MTMEHELGELKGELSGVKQEQRRLNEVIIDLDHNLSTFTKQVTDQCFNSCRLNNFDMNRKMDWKHYIWVTAILVSIFGAALGITFRMAESTDHRARENTARISRLENTHQYQMPEQDAAIIEEIYAEDH